MADLSNELKNELIRIFDVVPDGCELRTTIDCCVVVHIDKTSPDDNVLTMTFPKKLEL